MESFNNVPKATNENSEGDKEKLPTNLRNLFSKVSSSALAGAALVGAMAGVPADAEAAGQGSKLEQSENFSSQKETAAFLDKIASLDAGFKDARGRAKLRNEVVNYLNIYSLAVEKRTAYFSSSEDTSLSGNLSVSGKMIANQLLTSALSANTKYSGPGIDALKSALGLVDKSVTTPPRGVTERSVNRTKNW